MGQVLGEGGPVLAIDPGREKCGVAVVDPQGKPLSRAVVPRARLLEVLGRLARQYALSAVVVGNGTHGREVQAQLDGLAWVRQAGGVQLVDERGSSWAARRLYWQLHPPRGLWRLVPVGLRVPPTPWDDLAAVVLARRYLGLL